MARTGHDVNAKKRDWPLPTNSAMAGNTFVNFVTDTHYAYMPWSDRQLINMAYDVKKGLIPTPDAFLHGGDICDSPGEHGYQPGDSTKLKDQDDFMLTYKGGWLNNMNPNNVPSLWCMGNHDVRRRSPSTRAKWEGIYGRSANQVLDLPNMRIVMFAPDSHIYYYSDNPKHDTGWNIPDATWDWIDQQIGGTTKPVLLLNHYPPAELANVNDRYSAFADNPYGTLFLNKKTKSGGSTTSTSNLVNPWVTYKLADIVSSHSNIAGFVCGHMHFLDSDPRMASFQVIGNKTLPVISGPSPVHQTSNDRKWGHRNITKSLYMNFTPDHWEIRYRYHSAARWDGPDMGRITTMNLSTHEITGA